MTDTRLSPTDLALAQSDDAPDLPPSVEQRSGIVQLTSPYLVPGDQNFLGVAPGTIVLRVGDDRRPVNGDTGFAFTPAGFKRTYNEVTVGAERTLVTTWPELPSDAERRETPDGRRAVLRDNGNKIEEVIDALMIVDEPPAYYGVTFPFRPTGLREGPSPTVPPSFV
jgi:hypothetical protein